MFESREILEDQILTLLDALRALGDGRYACLAEPGGILLETPAPEDAGDRALRQFIADRLPALFRIPEAMAGDGPSEDVFEDWELDDFVLAFVNRRVAVVVACPEGERLRAQADRPLKALVDRLFRYNQAWRLDLKGRGLFVGRAQLDVIVAGRA